MRANSSRLGQLSSTYMLNSLELTLTGELTPTVSYLADQNSVSLAEVEPYIYIIFSGYLFPQVQRKMTAWVRSSDRLEAADDAPSFA